MTAMKLTLITALLAAAASAQTVATSVAVFNPVTGVKYYPTAEIATAAATIEARFTCSLPNAVPHCNALVSVLHYGVMVAVKSTDASVRAHEVTLRFNRDGNAVEQIEYLPANAVKTFWVGRVENLTTAVVPLKAAGSN